MKKLFFYILVNLSMLSTLAQEHAWSLPFDSDGEDNVSAICYAKDRIYTVGEYTGDMDVDPTSFVVDLNVGKAKNGFVAVYTASSELVNGFCFANGDGYHTVNGSRKHFDEGEVTVKDIEVDKSGYIYVAGYFKNTLDFNPQGEVFTITSPEGSSYSSSYDGFVAKYTPGGILLWIRQLSGDEDDEVSQVELDNDGNVYFQGSFSGSLDFDAAGEGDVHTGTESNYGNNVFVSKISSDNDYVYTMTMHSYNGAAAGRIFNNDFKIDASRNAMYLAGHFAYKAFMDASSEDYSLANERSGKYSGYIAKYDLDGHFIWASEAVKGDAATIAKINAIAINSDGDILSVGEFSEGTIIFNGGPQVSSDVVSYAGHIGLFSAVTGNNLWGWGITQGTDYAKCYPSAVVISPDNEMYVYGRFLESLTFNVANASTTLTVTESSDGGVRKYDNFLFQVNSTSVVSYMTSGGGGHDSPGGIALGDNKELYAAGAFAGEAVVNIQDEVSPYTVNFSADGGFVSRFNAVQLRSNAKNIVSTAVGRFDNEKRIITLSLNTTVAELTSGIEVSQGATFSVYNNEIMVSAGDSLIIEPSFTLVVKAENGSTQGYSLSVLSSRVYSTSIGELVDAVSIIKKIPEGTRVEDLLDALVYSSGALATILDTDSQHVVLDDTVKIASEMQLCIAYSDTAYYTLFLLETGKELISTQIGRIVEDTILCAAGVDIVGFSKGLEISEGASLSFYELGLPITDVTNSYLTSNTQMYITSEAGVSNVFQFFTVDNAENYILKTDHGILITITNEILYLDASLTVQELLDGFELSERALLQMFNVIDGEEFAINDAEDMTLEETMVIKVESVAGEIRTYSFKYFFANSLNDISFFDSVSVAFVKTSSQLILFNLDAGYQIKATLYKSSGQMERELVMEKYNNGYSTQVDLERGIYFMRCEVGNHVIVKKFIVY